MVEHLHGVMARQDLRAAGLGARAISSRLRRGELVRIRRALFVNPASRDDDLRRAATAAVALRGRGMVTGAAGLRLHGHDVRTRSHVVDVTVQHGVAVPDLDGIAFRRSSHLGHVRASKRQLLSVAAETWCLGDLARDVDDTALARIVAAGVGAGRWTLDRIERDALDRGKFPGRARLRRVLRALESDLPFSGTEKAAARALRDAGIPVVLQHPLRTSAGGLHLLDLAVVHLRLDLEVDGPHHWMPAQAATDRRRDREVRADDWEVERFPVQDLDHDMHGFVRDVQQLVARRARQLGR
jgi:very-short-patch-repair endonuclease